MRKSILFIIMLLAAAVQSSAQQYMYLWQFGEYTKISCDAAAQMPFSAAGSRITINGTTYYTSAIDSLTFTPPALNTEGKVVVTYNGASASVSIPAGVSGVTYSVSGAHVSLTSTNVADELEYVLQGTSNVGSLVYTGSYKCKFYLNGLNLTSNKNGAIDFQCGKRVELILHEGTVNTLCDASTGTQKATLYCKGHLEIEGAGTLNLTGRVKHAIRTKEYLQLKRSTGAVTVLSAAGDGLHAGQYFQMSGGVVNIANVAGDGVQAEITTDATDENNGQMIIKGGTLNVNVTGHDVDGLKCDDDLIISGGNITVYNSGNGSKGISVNGDMLVSEDDNATNIYVEATGGTYVNQTDWTTSRCMGIKVDFDMTVSAGKITVKNTNSASRSIKVDGTYTNNGGTVDATIE